MEILYRVATWCGHYLWTMSTSPFEQVWLKSIALATRPAPAPDAAPPALLPLSGNPKASPPPGNNSITDQALHNTPPKNLRLVSSRSTGSQGGTIHGMVELVVSFLLLRLLLLHRSPSSNIVLDRLSRDTAVSTTRTPRRLSICLRSSPTASSTVGTPI